MLWVKAFHIVFVSSWFAALFYLPRIFVNLAMVPADSHAERERLLLMGRKLQRFGSLLMVVSLALGFWLLWFFWPAYDTPWMWAKLALVAAAVAYHHVNGRLLRQFEASRNLRSHRWFRVFNEVSVLLFTGIVVLVVVRPL
jgi:putative membrane protein